MIGVDTGTNMTQMVKFQIIGNFSDKMFIRELVRSTHLAVIPKLSVAALTVTFPKLTARFRNGQYQFHKSVCVR